MLNDHWGLSPLVFVFGTDNPSPTREFVAQTVVENICKVWYND